jgi:hypothetical protein
LEENYCRIEKSIGFFKVGSIWISIESGVVLVCIGILQK